MDDEQGQSISIQITELHDAVRALTDRVQELGGMGTGGAQRAASCTLCHPPETTVCRICHCCWCCPCAPCYNPACQPCICAVGSGAGRPPDAEGSDQ